MKTFSAPRSGTVLIIVAGLSGLLASIALAFLARIQTNNAGDQETLQEAQARLMLVAACNYIQEASRIGWEHKEYKGKYHIETSGWIDVRDGTLGPKYNSTGKTLETIVSSKDISEAPYRDDGAQLGGVLFPIGRPARFPMFCMQRPPYAIQGRACYNPVVTNPKDADYTGLRAYRRYPDPQPSVDNGWTKNPSQPQGKTDPGFMEQQFHIWAAGDRTPRAETYGVSWFRLLREPSGSVFLVTVGAGGTMGWRDWKEVNSADPVAANNYFGNEDSFRAMQQGEIRHWYRVEWSPSVTSVDNHLLYHHEPEQDNYRIFTPNGGQSQGQFFTHNMGGTIQWIQRLRQEPTNW